MEDYIGTIKMFGGNYDPDGWLFCDGRLLSIASYQLLFAVIGTCYGGDGYTTFALPNLCRKVPLHPSSYSGVPIKLGENVGSIEHTLSIDEMPKHEHVAYGVKTEATSHVANGKNLLAIPGIKSDEQFVPNNAYVPSDPEVKSDLSVTLTSSTVGARGDNRPHTNLQPSIILNYLICWDGKFPYRK